ncbi:hypothetical protein IWW55_006286, partial [Coemansia sp. RSA 2706]
MSSSADKEVESAIEKYRRRRRELEEEERKSRLSELLDLGPDDDEKSVLNADSPAVQVFTPYVPAKQRRLEKMESIRQKLHYKDVSSGKDSEHESDANRSNGEEDTSSAVGPRANMSLVDQMSDLRKKHLLEEKTEEEKEREQERALLEAIARKGQLASAAELAKG